MYSILNVYLQKLNSYTVALLLLLLLLMRYDNFPLNAAVMLRRDLSLKSHPKD